ncbi:MAG TPA: histidinol-phosphate transaminase [Thermomicrobiales bacterium]|jgi:histidinol-phosphate aminotransferase|nr:histidinol-phosphate transaminase [Thermomicrobiales bacterium]
MADTAARPATDLTRLIRPALRDAHPYIPATSAQSGDQPGRAIKLDMNESPYGPSPKVARALASFHLTNRYPSITQDRLRDAIGRYVGVEARRIIPAAGMDDVLTNLYRAFVDDGDEVIISDPTFGVYRHAIAVQGGRVIDVPLGQRPDFAPDVDAILAAVTDRTRIIMVCNPNNPTGNLLPDEAIERIAREAPCVVAIDEAYAEFSSQSQLDLMERYDNVCILRTMSKWAGLAGMRVGYGVFPEWMLAPVWAVVPAFCNISTAAEEAAIAAFEDSDYLRDVVTRMIADRDALASRLNAMDGIEVFPSATNFLLFRLPIADAEPVFKELGARGIHVRFFGNPDHHMRDCLRVSIGTAEENALFANELQGILSEVAA